MLLNYSPHTPTLQCSSVGLCPKCISLLRWSVFLKKKLLAFNYRRVCQNSFHHPHNTAYFPCPSSLSTSTPISFFLLHHSTCIHWILWTAPGRNNSLPSPFIVALFVSSRHLPVHSNCTVLGSALLQTLGGTSVALTQHTGWGFFFHSKHPE